jgi:peptidoglycan hydrolase-like protein with peptidoglycan-binding domain
MKDIREGKWCADCVGLIKAFFWKHGDLTAQPVYKSNNCPDKSANGMIAYCSETGPISTMPDEPGLVVWKDGHIGVYVGGGYTVEMKGFAYDCKRNKLSSGPWKKWGRLPPSMIRYTDAPAPEPAPTPAPVKLGDRELKKGDKGDDVKELQRDLMKLGYKLPRYGADGDFGSETGKAVKAFQTDHHLTADGVMHSDDYTMLFAALDGQDIEPGTEPPTPAPTVQQVEITGGSVNVRSGPGTTGTRILGTVHKGDRLPWQGLTDEADGRDWYLVEYKNQNGWVSSKYARLV